LIDDVVVTPANTHDADAVKDLVADHVDDVDKPIVMGDSAYAGADTLDDLEQAGFEVKAKVPPAGGRGGMFGKDDFAVDLDADTVSCPAGHVVTIRRSADSSGRADFAEHCADCPLRHVGVGTFGHDSPERSDTSAGQKGPGRSSLAARVPVDPTEGGTQDRPLRARLLGRPQSTHPRPTTSCHRRRKSRRRRQPRPSSHARHHLHWRPMGDSDRLNRRTPGPAEPPNHARPRPNRRGHDPT
jgi:Transposase DDE domain